MGVLAKVNEKPLKSMSVFSVCGYINVKVRIVQGLLCTLFVRAKVSFELFLPNLPQMKQTIVWVVKISQDYPWYFVFVLAVLKVPQVLYLAFTGKSYISLQVHL